MTGRALRPAWLRPTVVVVAVAVHGMAFGVWEGTAIRPGDGVVEITVVSELAAPAETPSTPAAPPTEPVVTEATSPPKRDVAPPADLVPALEPTPAPPPPDVPPPEPAPEVVDPLPPLAVPTPRPEAANIEVEKRRERHRPKTRRETLDVEQPRRSAAESASASAAADRAEAHRAAVASYASLVAGEVHRRRYYPEEARRDGVTGTVVVAFTIGPNGSVTTHSIARSSGHAVLDAAVRAMMGGMRLPPPPGGVFRAVVPVRFETR